MLIYVKPLKGYSNREKGFLTEVSIVDYNGEFVIDREGTCYNFKEIIPLKDTVLTDINGKPIYEGSLVKFEDDLWGKSGTFTGKVKYHTSGYFAGSYAVNYVEIYNADFLGDLLEEKEVEVIGGGNTQIVRGEEQWM